MSVITRMRKQVAVWWSQGNLPPDSYGRPRYSPPVQLDDKVRWEDKTMEFIGKDGTPQISQSVVYVGRDMKVGDRLWLGVLADFQGNPSDPFSNQDVQEIKGFAKLPNFRNTEYLRTCYC